MDATPDRGINHSQQQVLQFQLQPNVRAAIEIDLVMELMNIPIDRVVPMPHLPPAVLGVYNWRGEILWIADFAKLLGLPESSAVDRQRTLQPTIVLTNNASAPVSEVAAIGFVVSEVNEIEWCDSQPIQTPATAVGPIPAQWLKIDWKSAVGEIWAGLDGRAIFERADLHAPD